MKTTDSRPRAAATLAVIVMAATGMLVANAVGTSGSRGTVRHGHAKRTGIAVFTHHPKGLARIAKAASPSLPPNSDAVLAAIVGKTELLVLHDSSGNDCLMHIAASGSAGEICDPPATAESEGEIGIGLVAAGAASPGSPESIHVDGLLPNGVSSVRITDRDGSSYDVPVTNNVIYHEDSEMASVSYVLPGGATVTTNAAALLDHIPRQPGAPGSSRIAP